MPSFSVSVRPSHNVTSAEVQDILSHTFKDLWVASPIDVRVGRQLKGSSHIGRRGVRLRPIQNGSVTLTVQPRGNDTNVELHLHTSALKPEELHELLRRELEADDAGHPAAEALTVLLSKGKHTHVVTKDSTRLLHEYLSRHGLSGTVSLTHCSDNIKGRPHGRLVWPMRRSGPTFHLGVQPDGRSSAFAVLFTPPVAQADAIWESMRSEWQKRDAPVAAVPVASGALAEPASRPATRVSREDALLHWLLEGTHYDDLLLDLHASDLQAGGWIARKQTVRIIEASIVRHGGDGTLAKIAFAQLIDDGELVLSSNRALVQFPPKRGAHPACSVSKIDVAESIPAPNSTTKQEESPMETASPTPDVAGTFAAQFERLRHIAAKHVQLSESCGLRRIRLSEIDAQIGALRLEEQQLRESIRQDEAVLAHPSVAAALKRAKDLEELFGGSDIDAAENVLEHAPDNGVALPGSPTDAPETPPQSAYECSDTH